MIATNPVQIQMPWVASPKSRWILAVEVMRIASVLTGGLAAHIDAFEHSGNGMLVIQIG